MANQGGVGGIAGSLILAVAILAGSFLVGSALDDLSTGLETVAEAVTEMKGAVGVAGNPTAAPTRRARRGLDPERVYTINTKGSPAMGPENAKITVVEFSDFQCPFCARALPTMAQVKEAYGDQVRVVFKHLPLSIHPKAPAAHSAAAAAHSQGKFWEMHDLIFQNQREMSPENYERYAAELGLDLEKFKADLDSPAIKGALDRDVAEARALGVTGTPSFFVNGRFLSGARPFEEFKVLIDKELGS